ncbi:MAG: hypothetical protein WAK95_20115 [Desulfobacterales bacterium]
MNSKLETGNLKLAREERQNAGHGDCSITENSCINVGLQGKTASRLTLRLWNAKACHSRKPSYISAGIGTQQKKNHLLMNIYLFPSINGHFPKFRRQSRQGATDMAESLVRHTEPSASAKFLDFLELAKNCTFLDRKLITAIKKSWMGTNLSAISRQNSSGAMPAL